MNATKEWMEKVKEQLLDKDEFNRKLGLSFLKCPTCKANLSISEFLKSIDLICLNGCHLSKSTQEFMRSIASTVSKTD